MYGDVNVTVEDRSLGRSSSTGSGVQFKIGISNIESATPILITGSMDAKKIKEKVGNTPLADACIDSVENGAATIYCIPVKATTDGTIGEVKAVKTGEGTLEVSGKPNNAYDIVIKVTDDGENNEAGYAYSLDGGNTFSEEMTVPLNGEAVLANTGLTAKFTEAAGGDSFKEGDTFSFSTTAPSMSNADVISAVESLINNNTAFEYAHIVGTSSRALWASLASIANDFLTKYKRPLFFVCEARMKRSNESLDEYVAAMQEERKGINNIYIQVVCSNSRYQRMDGRVQDINNAGIVCGLYCKAKESQSIGEVKSFPISEAKMLKLLESVRSTIANKIQSARDTVNSVLESIKSAFSSKLQAAHSVVTGAISRIRSAFNFSWHLPSLELPHISVSGGVAPFGIGGKGSLPHFSIQWYKDGGILNGATIFGQMGGKMLGGGEAGAEAVLPLATLWTKMKEVVGNVVKGENEESKSDVQQTGASITSALTSKASTFKREKETTTTTNRETVTTERWGKNGSMNINSIHFTVDISKIKDLPLLYKLIDELKDAQNRTDVPVYA